MTTHIETINLPLEAGGEVRLTWQEAPAVIPDALPGLLALGEDDIWEMGPSELGIATENALHNYETTCTADADANADEVSQVASKVGAIRFEQFTVKFSQNVTQLQQAFGVEPVVVPRLDAAFEDTGEQPMSMAELFADDLEEELPPELAKVLSVPQSREELDGVSSVAAEAPKRLQAEQEIITRVRQEPTQLNAHESALALSALRSDLDRAMAQGDAALQAELLGAVSWILGNTTLSEIIIDETALRHLEMLESTAQANPELVLV